MTFNQGMCTGLLGGRGEEGLLSSGDSNGHCWETRAKRYERTWQKMELESVGCGHVTWYTGRRDCERSWRGWAGVSLGWGFGKGLKQGGNRVRC